MSQNTTRLLSAELKAVDDALHSVRLKPRNCKRLAVLPHPSTTPEAFFERLGHKMTICFARPRPGGWTTITHVRSPVARVDSVFLTPTDYAPVKGQLLRFTQGRKGGLLLCGLRALASDF